MSKIYTLDQLYTEPLPTPAEFKEQLPMTAQLLEFIQGTRRQVVDILDGSDNRLLLIVGPCSIHDPIAAKEYAGKLKRLAAEVSKQFLIIMRTYFEKPRTALGWKGMIYDPHLDGSNNMVAGIRQARELLITLAEMQVPAATEFLDPMTYGYLGDLITWSCIGARTAESQIHRQFASGLSMPVAFKNNTMGNVDVAINGMLTASTPHTFFGIDDSGSTAAIHTKGNRHAHLMLRGGESGPNCDADSVHLALERLKKHHLPERLIIDCSHDNSGRWHEGQKQAFSAVIQQYCQGNQSIRGLAIESHLFAGNQQIPLDKSRLRYAVSVTDPCLDWESTECLILEGAALLDASSVSEALAESILAK